MVGEELRENGSSVECLKYSYVWVKGEKVEWYPVKSGLFEHSTQLPVVVRFTSWWKSVCRMARDYPVQFVFQILSPRRLVCIHTALFAAPLWPLHLCCCWELKNVGSVYSHIKTRTVKWCASQQCRIYDAILKNGGKMNLNGKAMGVCPDAPCLSKLCLASFSFPRLFCW